MISQRRGAVRNAGASKRSFNIAGAEQLTYRAMAERVFRGLGLKPRFAVLPTGLLREGFRAASALGLLRNASFGSSVFQRMNEDLVFDVAEGLQVLGYQPRPFEPNVPAIRATHTS